MSRLFKNRFPHLLEEYDYELNQHINLDKLTYGSDKEINWICRKKLNICGCIHRWTSATKNRTKKNATGCPYCCITPQKTDYHLSLKNLRPDLIEEWDYDNNGDKKPENYTISSNIKINWKCIKNVDTCGCVHKWPSSIYDRTRIDGPKGCPYCCEGNKKVDYHKSISFLRPDLLPEWNYLKNGEIKPEEISLGSNIIANWICSLDNDHEYPMEIYKRCKLNSGCKYHKNKTEQILYKFLSENYRNFNVEQQCRFNWCINPETGRCLPFDFVIDELKLIIELDGPQHFQQISNWGSYLDVQKRDIYKIKKCIENEYSIIHILQKDVFENLYDWKKKLEIMIKKYDTPEHIFISEGTEYEYHKKMLIGDINYNVEKDEYQIIINKIRHNNERLSSMINCLKKIYSQINKLHKLL